MKLKKINEDHYVLEHEDGSTFKVAKKALNKTAQSKIESMAHKFNKGGFVPVDVNYKPALGFIPDAGGVVPVDVNYKPAPGFIPDADFKPDYGDKPKFTGVTRATPQEQMQAAKFAPGTADVYKTAVDQPRPVRQAPIQPYMPEQAPGGAEEAMISPIDFITPSMVTAPAKAIAKGAMGAGRELVEAFPRMMASEAGSIGAQKAAPRINPLGMYSKLEQTIEEKMGGSATPEQIKGMLRDVKPEEMQYSGLNDFLQGKNKVSKQEVLDFVKANELPVQEKLLGYSGDFDLLKNQMFVDDQNYANLHHNFLSKFADETDFSTSLMIRNAAENDVRSIKKLKKIGFSEEEINNLIDANKKSKNSSNAYYEAKVKDETKFSQYTLPGGENYREKLYTLPQGSGGWKMQQVPEYPEYFDVVDQSGRVRYTGDKDGAKSYLEEMIQSYNPNDYKSSHWNEPNVLAHTRLNDRIDAEGRKHLFVEEIQSDWHQAGRKKGYANPQEAKKIQDELSALPKTLDFPSWLLQEDPGMHTRAQAEKYINTAPSSRPPYINELIKDYYEYANPLETKKEQLMMKRNALEIGVPDAPLKKNWHEFVSKNLLNDAAKGGYDNVSWTTGAQQAARYDLSKELKTIKSIPYEDGTGYQVQLYKPDGKFFKSVEVKSLSEMDEWVGKDITKKIIEEDAASKGSSSYVDLSEGTSIGGEGMKGFYDKIVPDYMAKIGKKYGVKPEKTKINVGSNSDYNYNDFVKWAKTNKGEDLEFLSEMGELKKISQIEKEYKKHISNTEVWTMKITPEMRKEILEKGFPLYSVGGVLAGGMLNSEKAEAKDMNYKLIKNEKDHYVMKHPDGSSFKVAKKGLKSDIVNQIESMGKGYAFGGVSKLDEEEPVASTMPEQSAPDFQQMVQDNPVSPQEAINKQINQAKQDITGRLGAMYSKSGIPQSYDDARIQREAEEQVLAGKESEALAAKNEGYLAQQKLDSQVAEAQAWNERAAKYGLPLRTVPGQAAQLAQDQAQVAPTPSTGMQAEAQMGAAPKAEIDPFKQYESAYRQTAKAEEQLNKSKMASYDQAKIDIDKANQTYTENVARYNKDAEDFKKQIQDNPVDAKRYYKNLSTGGKISAAIGLMVAGIGAGLTRTENAALKVINSAIDADIEAQKQNINQADNLYKEALSRVRNEDVAFNQTKAKILGMVELDIKKAEANASTAQQKAALQKNLADVQMARQAYVQKSALTDVVKLAQQNPQMITPELAQMLPEDQRARIVPGAGFTYTKEGAQKVREIKANRDDVVGLIEQLEAIRKQAGRELTASEASSKAQAIGQILIGKLREPVVGPGAMTEGEYERLQTVIPKDVTQVASFDSNVFARLQTAKDVINNSYMNRARAEGINFPVVQAQQGQVQIQAKTGIPHQKVPGGWIPYKTGR